MKRVFLGLAITAGLMTSVVTSQAATLGSFIQSNVVDTMWFLDGGAGGSSLGSTPSPMNIMWTFQAPNSCAGIGTTVPAKLTISAVDAGAYNPLTLTQPLANLAFTITDPTATINYLSGTSPLADLAQSSSGGASINVGFAPQGLLFTSQCYTLNPLDITQNFSLSFTSANPLNFGDTNANGILDTTTFNVTGLASAAVPEPGSMALVLGATFGGGLLAARRRRARK